MPERRSAGDSQLQQAPFQPVCLPEGEIEYRRIGSGRPLVFVHGVFVNGDLWRGVVEELAGSFDCIVLELPLGGHRTPLRDSADLTPGGLANLVAQVVIKLGLQPVDLVANDSGGAISQILTARRPELVRSLVLTACDTYEDFFPPLFKALPWMARTPGAMWLGARLLQRQWVRNLPIAFRWATRRPIDPEIAASYVRPLLEPGIRGDLAKALRDVRPEYTLRAAEGLRSYTGRVLLVWGGYDRFFPVRNGQRLSADIPNSELVVLPDVGAFVPEDAPEELAELITKFHTPPITD